MSSSKENDHPPISHEEEVKRAAEIREWLESEIEELEAKTSKYRDMLTLVDGVLRKSSFVPATELRNKAEKVSEISQPKTTRHVSSAILGRQSSSRTSQNVPAPKASDSSNEQVRQLRRSKDGMILANAQIDNETISITPESGVKLLKTTPPFESFFVNRILKGFEAKDKELSSSGKLDAQQVLSFDVEESDGMISKVKIRNYRDKNRLNEILNTISWAFARMLEKK